jgi:hypothetical protein
MKEPGSQLAKMCDPEAVLSQPAVFKVGQAKCFKVGNSVRDSDMNIRA